MKLLWFILAALLIGSCSNNNERYVIKGEVDKKLNGKKAYLVPFENATAEFVDSTVVENGRFSFSGTADSTETKILRINKTYPIIVQDLVVVLDKGEINAKLDTFSKGGGTILNDKLQEWKEWKENIDSLEYAIFKESKEYKGDSIKLDSLAAIKDSIQIIKNKRNYNCIIENVNNGIGLFVCRYFGYSLSTEQKKKIYSKASDKFKNNKALKNIFKDIK